MVRWKYFLKGQRPAPSLMNHTAVLYRPRFASFGLQNAKTMRKKGEKDKKEKNLVGRPVNVPPLRVDYP